MNTDHHCVIFNKQRNCMMAVSEVASSTGKGKSRTKRFKTRNLPISSTSKFNLIHFYPLKTVVAQSIRAQVDTDSIAFNWLATLGADNAINLIAAKNESSQTATQSNSSSSLNISYSATTGWGAGASAAKGSGKSDGQDTSYTNTQIAAGNTASIKSGGDTNLVGAVVAARQIKADIGGSLNIESLQDTSTYTSRQKSAGTSISVPIGPGAASGSVSAGKSNTNSNFQSVNEQSGLKAGDAGFQVNVGGNTDLRGSVIASTQTAVDANKNTFTSAGPITITDLQNTASYSGRASGGTIGVGTELSKSGAGVGSKSGNAASTSSAGISGIAGNTAVRTGDAETGLKSIFDADKVQREINAQVAITAAFSKEAPKAVATFSANQMADLKRDLAKETDPEKQAAIKAEMVRWDEGGRYRVLLHTLAGAFSGGASGAAGAAASASAAPLMNQLQDGIANGLQTAGLSADVAKGIASSVAGLTAAGAGAAVGGAAGAATAFTVDVNNRQLHPTEVQLIQRNARRYAQQLYGAANPSKEQVEAATIMLVNTAQNSLDNNMGVTIPNFSSASDFLQTLKIEYRQQNGSLVLPDTQGTQQLFYASVEQKNQPWLDQGLADPALTGLIVRTPLTAAVNNPTNDPTRDRLTGLPLDEKGRYSVQLSVDGQNFAPKYFPCATSACIAGGKNLDQSDPATQVYLKAMDKKIFDDINKAATVVAIVNPVGAAGSVAFYAGPISSVAAGIVEDQSLNALLKEGLQAAAGAYLQKVYGFTQALATRVTSTIDLAGGWQAFVDRAKTATGEAKK